MTVTSPPIEVVMLTTQDDLGKIADRIEQAYGRRHSFWKPIGISPGVWVTAASRLFEVLEEDPEMPIDPELFVAAQSNKGIRPDPWVELTQRRSLRLYLRLVRKIIKQLREELKDELRLGERQVSSGLCLDALLEFPGFGLSSLSCYILAHRAGRHDLASRFRYAAEAQHRACPLYEIAARDLIPAVDYPLPTEAFFHDEPAFSRN